MWVIYALTAAVVWGTDYALAEKVLKKISVLTFLGVEFVVATLFFLLFTALRSQPSLKSDLNVLATDHTTLGLLIATAVLYGVGNLLICYAIQSSNASWASLLEITYPLFVILASWFLFKTGHLNTSVVVGGILIMSGVGIITYFNK